MNIAILGFALLTSACNEPAKAPVVETVSSQVGEAPKAAKTVSVEVLDTEQSYSATVRVGDTLKVTLPMWPGTEWKVVGEQPSTTEFVDGFVSPTVGGMRYGFKIAGAKGKRTIKFIGSDANIPNEVQTVTVNVTVE